MATATSTAVASKPVAASPHVTDGPSTRARPRSSTIPIARRPRLRLCPPLSHSSDPRDMLSSAPLQTLASLRLLVLSYLADIERSLAELESPHFETWKVKREHTMEEVKQWTSVALEMLEGIRTEVMSRLPELHLSEVSVGSFKHLPDIPHLPEMPDMRSHLPDFKFSDVRSKLVDVRSRIHDIDFHQPLSYIPTLSDRLDKLYAHLTSVEVPPGVRAPSLTPSAEVIEEGEGILEKAAFEVSKAAKRSLQGVRLIRYSDLPHAWKNNPFVTQGYRFIPIERWPLLIMSIFALHNETLNIHTHLIPLILWGVYLGRQTVETPELLFMAFALLCLFCSALWHTMSGCAHYRSMVFCARVDYVGIGWLISASVGTVVYYGYQCHPTKGYTFLWLCFLTGLAGNIFPFMDWFNERKYRSYRIGFFLAMAFSSIAPLAFLSLLHTPDEVVSYISPIVPSLLSYIIGLIFYAAHFPECMMPEKMRCWLDHIGLGSHMIWHCFIVLAVNQHRVAISALKSGLECRAVYI
ncbi:hemolysin-III related domain containing protein [Amanita muscaria]